MSDVQQPPNTAGDPPLQVGILVFDDVEVLDFAGPYEVFTTASRVHGRSHATAPLFAVRTVARRREAVRARAGLVLLPDADFAQAPGFDLLIVPGGVVTAAMQCPATLAWLRAASAHARITASVCTGSFLLAASGVIVREQVTTHWEDIEDLRAQFPALDVVQGPRWVDLGRLLSSAGISAGMDMSLHLVARLGGEALAHRTAKQMDYAWNPIP
ncbi:DJ-1/PfpI family protein [Rhodoferax aquaticus]|uniref:DJ-1/PfpI family protein n=1 Tax=Rhodoferax aquaticus TaxID=2527691 RepID=A0A515EKV6_9BURK|nr:DJ-1/PfpI family protein [Rhodoferax aquaticus]QDL53303.1 DJ-1/PfpI family protein [Rhodoferax aquaticus]